jgi:site-specific DNA-methyltransferase (adenine-specific)
VNPYYRHGQTTLYHGDALAVLTSLPAGCLDSVITDPPYCSGSVSEASRTSAKGQGLRSESLKRFGWFVGDNMGTAGLVWLLRALAFECVRVVKPTGSLVVFCDWRMVSSVQPAVESAGLRYQNLVVWDKGCMGLGTGFRCQHELALHFTLGAPEYHAKDVANVLRAGRVGAAEREHQAEKPVDLLAPIVRVVSPPGGLVCDPFMGSGAVGAACLDNGRLFLGVDRDAGCCEGARRRLANTNPLFAPAASKPPTLFDFAPQTTEGP